MFENTNQTDNELLLDTDLNDGGENKIADNSEPSFTVKYDGVEKALSLNELLVLAQKGMNYDRVVSQRDKLKNEAVGNNSESEQGFMKLFSKHPEINELPDEVYKAIAEGETPIDAYRNYENALYKKQTEELTRELSALKNNEKNSAKAMSSQKDSAPQQSADDFLSGLFG